MRLRALIIATAVLLASACLGSASAAGSRPTLTEAGNAVFPDRSYLLTLPVPATLAASQVHVTENGRPVTGATLVSANRVGREFGVVLLIDSSDSMSGSSIRAAMAAARDFVSVPTGPGRRLGLVFFNSRIRLALPLTANRSAIQSALRGTPRLHEGTRIDDAVVRATQILVNAHVAARSIVLLSDGADVGSTATGAAAARIARAAHVRVFAVGLRSRAFDAKPLQALARDTGGLYVPARSAGKLEGIYRQLGSVLANQYLLRYHSLVGSSQRSTTVNVRVRVDGFAGDARTGYAAPASSASARVFRQPLGIRLWTARTTQVLVILVSAVLLAFAVIVVLRPRKTRLPQRMAQFVSVGTPEETQGSITGRMLLEAERSLDGAPWWERLKENLELAEMDVPPSHVVAGTIVATIFSMWLLSLLTPLAVLLALFVPLGVRAFIALKVGRVRKAFEDQLPDNLLVLASAMKAGHSFIAALSVVADDALEPSRSEFRRVVADEQLGVPAEEALQVVVRRMASRDVEQVALVAAVQRQSGGNSAEVLGRVAETVRERAELRRLVKTLTAPGRVSGWIVTSLPLALLSVITVINRPYMAQMYTDPMGQVLLVVGAFMLIFGAIVIQRIVNIKV